MKDFFKYLTSGNEDKEWGLYVTVAGKDTSLPGTDYPKSDHPTGYYFEWDTWRTLHEFQLVYITEGAGRLETAQGTYRVLPGDLMLIYPDLTHRYRPDIATGWTENYIGFSGKLSHHFISHAFPDLKSPIIHCDNQYELVDTFHKINDVILKQRPSYQKVCSGLLLKLIGYIESQVRSQQFKGKDVDTLVNDAKTFMWENIHEEIDFREFAQLHNVSYSYFRKIFRIYTGIAPHQFYLDLKMVRAKELIISTDISIKEIAYMVGFSSIQYFSRLFKRKTGKSPSELRVRN